MEAEDTAAPHKEFQEELVKARRGVQGARRRVTGAAGAQADGERTRRRRRRARAGGAPRQFGVLEPIIVEADVEEAAPAAPAPLEASDITAAVVEAADDSTVATGRPAAAEGGGGGGARASGTDQRGARHRP